MLANLDLYTFLAEQREITRYQAKEIVYLALHTGVEAAASVMREIGSAWSAVGANNLAAYHHGEIFNG